VFIEAKDDGGGGDNCIIGAINLAKLQSNHQQQTNIQPRVISGKMGWLNKKTEVVVVVVVVVVWYYFSATH